MENPDQQLVHFIHFDEVRAQLDNAAALLKCAKDDLEIFRPEGPGHAFQATLAAMEVDHYPQRSGLTQGLPFIHTAPRQQMKNSCVFPYIGMRLYGPRGTNRYFVASTRYDGHSYYSAIFCRKGHVYSIARAWNRARQNSDVSNNKPPFLADGILEDVVKHSIELIKNRRKLTQYNIRPVYGMLLCGSPGNGKTMLCKYIKTLARQNEIRTENFTASDIDRAYKDNDLEALFYGGTMSGSWQRDCVLFFDDIDISYLNRASGNGRVACSILSAMDGISPNDGSIIRIFTTNEDVSSLDAAFVRPGRIDQTIQFNPPEASLRREFLSTWPKDILNHIGVPRLVSETEGQSFASIDSIKTALVIHYMDTGEWSLDKVLEKSDYHHSHEHTKVGF